MSAVAPFGSAYTGLVLSPSMQRGRPRGAALLSRLSASTRAEYGIAVDITSQESLAEGTTGLCSRVAFEGERQIDEYVRIPPLDVRTVSVVVAHVQDATGSEAAGPAVLTDTYTRVPPLEQWTERVTIHHVKDASSLP